jgi:hypothetical protein
VKRSFAVRHCWQGKDGLLWLDAAAEADALATAEQCAGGPALPVIVAATELQGGGGDFARATKLGLSIVGLSDVATQGVKVAVLAHEVGHALGLLDEYIADSMTSAYVCGRNVFDPSVAGVNGCEEEPGWVNSCTPNVPETCPGCPAAWGCARLCGPECLNESCPDVPVFPVGLFEGADYRRCGVYRSEATCAMVSNFYPFCQACKDVVDETLRSAYGGPCARWTPITTYIEPRDPSERANRLRVCAVPARGPRQPSAADHAYPPGIPPGDAPPPGSCWPLQLRDGDWRATVEVGGVNGEVRVGTILVPFRDRERTHILELAVGRDRAGTEPHITIDGKTVAPGALLSAPDAEGTGLLGTIAGDVTVIDDVKGVRWKALALRVN